jgi:hypothetical protein
MNLKKLTAFAVTVAQLSVACPAYADPVSSITLPTVELQPNEPDVGAALSPMKRGQIAPFTGVLLSSRATAELIVQLNSIKDQIKIEVDRALSEERAQCDFKVSEVTTTLTADKKVLQANVDFQGKQISILTDQLKKEEQNRSNTGLWTGLGVAGGLVVGVGVTLLSVVVVGQASK